MELYNEFIINDIPMYCKKQFYMLIKKADLKKIFTKLYIYLQKKEKHSII